MANVNCPQCGDVMDFDDDVEVDYYCDEPCEECINEEDEYEAGKLL